MADKVDDDEIQTVVTIRAFGKTKRNFDKAEVNLNAIRSNALDADDEFAPFFKDKGLMQKANLLQPPYNQTTLAGLCQMNNALSPAVEAMVTNIDGTGHVIKLKDEDENVVIESFVESGTVEPVETEKPEEKKKRKSIEDFFEEVFPGMSFRTLRKNLRRDQEVVGNAYIEAMRNTQNKLTFLRQVRSRGVRLVKFDAPVSKEIVLKRGGEDVSVTMMATERRYAQIVGTKIVFFKEFKASRELDKLTGVWEGTPVDGGEPHKVLPENRANELIHLTAVPDAISPYGLPRWIPQLPSVLGSRKAEESNLEFFDSGGIPPALITIAGGKAAVEGAATLEKFFSGELKYKQRALILEVQNSGGSLEKEGSPSKIEVHTFGAEQVKDSMFEEYDTKSERRVRRAFRLPPLFVGQAEDFSFATAFASYTVAEAQVFAPERDEFDEIVNNIIMPELDPEGDFKFESKPITVNDTVQRLDAIKIALEAGGVGPKGVVEAVNDLVNLNLKFDPNAVPVDVGGTFINIPIDPVRGGPKGSDDTPNRPPATTTPVAVAASEGVNLKIKVGNVVELSKQAHINEKKKKKAEELVEMATRANSLMHQPDLNQSADALVKLSTEIAELDEQELPIFNSILSVLQFNSVDNDPEGLARLAGCSLAVLAANLT